MVDETVKSKAAKAAATADAASLAATDPVKARILDAYKDMLRSQFYGTCGIILVLGGVLAVGWWSSWSPPLLPLVVLSGALGAFFSALTRLYHVDDAGTALITPTVGGLTGPYMFMYASVPPVIGAVAALVLYMLFVSGLVAGDLFPSIDCVAGKTCKTIKELMENFWPVEPSDYGKALVWSFIAGFSERFVPDLLQSLVKKQETKTEAAKKKAKGVRQ